jgi:CRP-like cAMP-binding protein
MDVRTELLHGLFRRIEIHDALAPEERNALLGAAGELRTIPARTRFVQSGAKPSSSTLLVSGIAARTVSLETGERQITAFHLAGDFVDLHSLPLQVMDHDVEAVTDVQLLYFPHERLRVITAAFPHLTRVLWLLTLLDAAIQRQWLAVMGALDAQSRMAHLFCELYYRARSAGLAKPGSCRLPFHQGQIGEALAMSIVTVNRTMQTLRRTGAMEFRNGTLTVFDWKKLAEQGEFDPNYLNLRKPARL